MHEVLIVKDPQEFPVAGFDSCLPAGRFVTPVLSMSKYSSRKS